ncbi:MAG: dihydroorotase [Thaumarchaeota archaeon]|nr:dihydroorotase [Nitrososphaerota archaeon]
MIDLVIVGKAYLDGRIEEAAIGIDEGKIVSVSKPAHAPSAEKKLILESDELALPGMVDMHVHLRDLNQSYKEDWYTGTLSALRGGVTLVGDMPNNDPPITSLSRLRHKLEIAESKALVDFVLYCGIPENPIEIPEIKRIACGFKAYPEDYERLWRILDLLKGSLLVVHAEDPEVIEERRRSLGRGPRLEDHAEIRPREAELRAVERLLNAARGKGLRMHFTHLSLGGSISRTVSAKLGGEDITCDVTLHHALLSSDLLGRLGGIAKVNPPLRSMEDVRAVFNAIKSGCVDAIVSDHAPHLLEEKLREDYDSIPPGFPGLEIYLPIILTLILERRLPLQAIDLYSKNPARILGVGKGVISPGVDADITIARLGVEKRINASSFSSKAKYTPFEGWVAKASITKVFLRGALALEEGDIMVSRGFGRNAYRPRD